MCQYVLCVCVCMCMCVLTVLAVVCVAAGCGRGSRWSEAHLRRDPGEAGHHHERADGRQHRQRGRRREVLRDHHR